MADYDGILSSDSYFAAGSSVTAAKKKLPVPFPFVADVAAIGTPTTTTLISSSQDRDGLMGHNHGDDEIYGRVWVLPAEIDAGFIADQKEYEISVWNAFAVSKQITAIAVNSGDGLDLDYDTLPITLPRDGEDIHALSILVAGPPSQDSMYTYTVSGVDYTVSITGQRVVPFVYEPNWAKAVKLSYEFHTLVSRSKTYKEQRRAMQDTPRRKESLEYIFLDYLEYSEAKNTLEYAFNKVLVVPIFTETILLLSTVTGNTVINTSDTSDMYNYQNLTDFVLVHDFASDLWEVKEVESFTNTTVTFTRAVQETIVKESALMYPLMLTTLPKINFQIECGNPVIAGLGAEFTEYING